jgi:hypothetical protein
VNRAEMQRRLATEFERHGWEYDLTTSSDLLDEVERAGSVDPERLAVMVPREYRERVGATTMDLHGAIKHAIGGRTLTPEQPPTHNTITINDNRYSIKVGEGAQISGGNLNTGSQIAIQGGSPKEDVLDAVATLVTAGLGGEWNVEAIDDLARAVAARDDITLEDVRVRALDAAQQTGAGGAKIRALLEQIASGTAIGVLTPGITAALGHLL